MSPADSTGRPSSLKAAARKFAQPLWDGSKVVWSGSGNTSLKKMGVEEVALRCTRLRDPSGVVWYVRNGEILRVANRSQGWTLATVDIPIAYNEDIEKVRAIVDKVADKKGTRAVAEAYLKYWYTREGQEIAARNSYRPRDSEIAKEYEGKLTVAKVNIDDNPMTPNDYAVRGIPTMILFKDGKPVDTKVGAMPKGALKSWLSGAIGG